MFRIETFFPNRAQNVTWPKTAVFLPRKLAIAERLAKSDPGNALWQHDLIVSCKKIADCSPPGEKRANLSRALEIAQTLHTSGRLAPADKWMLGVLAKLIAEVSAK